MHVGWGNGNRDVAILPEINDSIGDVVQKVITRHFHSCIKRVIMLWNV